MVAARAALRQIAEAAKRSRLSGGGVIAANMSLSNKLTLDKVDVKGKRVVMR